MCFHLNRAIILKKIKERVILIFFHSILCKPLENIHYEMAGMDVAFVEGSPSVILE